MIKITLLGGSYIHLKKTNMENDIGQKQNLLLS